MKILENFNMWKIIIAIFFIGVIAFFAFGYDFGSLSKASLVGTSEIQEIDGTSYVYININENLYDKQDIGTIKNIGFKSVKIDGQTNSKGQQIEGELTSTFRVKINDIGFKSIITPKFTEPMVNHGEISSGLFKTFSYTIDDPVQYYQVTGDTSILSSYTLLLNVNGKNFKQIIDYTTPSGLVKIEGTNPPIYWDETSFGLSRTTDFPTGIESVDIIKNPQGDLTFVKRDQMNEMVKYWNAIFKDNYIMINNEGTKWNTNYNPLVVYHSQIPKRIDLNNDGKYDLSEPGNDFTYTNLLSNNYRYKSSSNLLGGAGAMWIDFPSGDKAPFKYDKDTNGYSLITVGDDYLKKDTILSVQGVWRIPAEYGDVKVKTYIPVPEITNIPKFNEPIYTTTTTKLLIDVKNTGDTGPIYVGVYSLDSPGLILPSDSTPVTITTGDSHTFELTFKGKTVRPSTKLVIFAKGGTTLVTKTVDYEVKEFINAETHRITINAVDEHGNLLGSNFPIIVSQNSQKRYGVWIGNLMKGEVNVYGEEVIYNGVTYYPNNFKYDVSKDATISLTYTTEPPSENETNWITLIIVGFIFLVLSIIILWLWND